ncbi:unnamed protein product [Durusdinium trenchii]|uniref:Mei2-like C-terminal RNA recognition motif domain-containing protein n=1 Tax=Durusdinium trenchii TaxID=1381693 RepID=A0ABP0MCR6_9DINO
MSQCSHCKEVLAASPSSMACRASTTSAHVFINGRWSSKVVSFTLELDASNEDPQYDVLLVKSTFLEFSDGLSLQDRFRQIRKALTDPIFDKETYIQIYEPGIDFFRFKEPMEPMNIELNLLNSPVPSLCDKEEDFEDGGRMDALSQNTSAPSAQQAAKRPKTTVMLRNLPNNYTRSMLAHLLDERGFTAKYDFLYLPIDFDRKANLGYAFVNLVAEDVVEEFWRTFDGFDSWSFPSSKVCQVSWSGPKQGLKAHLDRYKNSPVMHKSVPDEYKPILLSNGVRKRFPAPTIRVQHPKKAGKHV